jgi:hypothetical protein
VLKVEARTVEELFLEGYMFGYIDPAAGATIMQLIVAGTVGLGAVVKLKWHTISGYFNRADTTVDQSSGGTAESHEGQSQSADSQS